MHDYAHQPIHKSRISDIAYAVPRTICGFPVMTGAYPGGGGGGAEVAPTPSAEIEANTYLQSAKQCKQDM